MKAQAKCHYCGDEFTYHTTNSTGKYCSVKCQMLKQNLIVMEGGNPTQYNAKTYLRSFVDYECSLCGISEWRGNPITLQMDHINGDLKNNKKDNIRWLCPNCHTQTDTWGSGNISKEGKKRRYAGCLKGSEVARQNKLMLVKN